MKRFFLSGALFCGVLILISPVMADVSETTIMLKVVNGVVEVQKQGEETWNLVEEKALLGFDDQIRTNTGAQARLLYSDTSMLKLKEKTMVQIGRGELRVRVGEAWVRVIKKGTHFQVVTPTLIAGVKGTIFDVKVKQKGASSVRTYSGLVAVKAGGEEVILRPGYTTSADGGTPSSPKTFEAEKAAIGWRFSNVDILRDKIYLPPTSIRTGRIIRVPNGSNKQVGVTFPGDSGISLEEAELRYKRAKIEFGESSDQSRTAKKILDQVIKRLGE